MKPALNQQAIRATTGTQNWTDASITSDQTCQLFFGTEATANNTTTAAAKLFLGATDLANNIGYTIGTLDAAVASSALSHSNASTTACVLRTTSSGSESVAAAVSATLTNGLTLNYTTADAGTYLFNGLSLAGSDHVAHCSSTQFASTDLSKVVTHGDTSAPDALILFASVGSTGTDVGSIPQRGIIAFWDGTNSVSTSIKCSTQTSPTDLAARINTDLGHMIDGVTDADVATLSIGSVTGTTFTLTRTATGSLPMFVTVLALRHTSGTWAFKCGTTTLPASTGITPLVSGMSVQPQVLITVATRLTSNALAANSDAAGGLSFGVACNNAGTTQQFACALTEKNAVATTVAKCYTTNNAAILALDNTGAVIEKGAVSSWDTGGASVNHTVASATQVMYFAFGTGTVLAPQPIVPGPKQTFVTETVIQF